MEGMAQESRQTTPSFPPWDAGDFHTSAWQFGLLEPVASLLRAFRAHPGVASVCSSPCFSSSFLATSEQPVGEVTCCHAGSVEGIRRLTSEQWGDSWIDLMPAQWGAGIGESIDDPFKSIHWLHFISSSIDG
jgi:hypothetical protein